MLSRHVARGSFKRVPKEPLGLYRPELEKDSCGVGMVANLKGKPSHKIVQDANVMLARMSHRGGCGCEANTGDGAGILAAMPDGYYRKVALNDINLELPEKGQYASGMVFSSVNQDISNESKKLLEFHVKNHGLEVIGWRKIPTNNTMLGMGARLSEPSIEQVFVHNKAGYDSNKFELELMRARKCAEDESVSKGIDDFYVCSLSGRTITIKGQLTPEQLPQYYLDLNNSEFESHMALVHSRFSTNTFPSWDRAQPNRMLCHNGEINTLRGNKNWMVSRSSVMESPLLDKDDQHGLLPIVSDNMTDSGNADLALELLTKGSGRPVHEAMMMMIPEAWQNDPTISADKRAFYEYHSNIMEPWDGPAMMAFSDGRYVGACLDRNGLRPSRFYVTNDDHVILSSEVGVLPELDPSKIVHKGRLQPGKIFLVDFEEERIIHDNELKERVVNSKDYGGIVSKNLSKLEDWVSSSSSTAATTEKQVSHGDLRRKLNAFGYTTETIDLLLAPMAIGGKEALGSMGVDTPLAVLSEFPKAITEYFKQLFAQVTNPPIDPIRESVVMSLVCPVGPEANLLEVGGEKHAQRLIVSNPILTEDEMNVIKSSNDANAYNDRWYSLSLDATFKRPTDANNVGDELKSAIESLCNDAERAVADGKVPILILNHDSVDENRVPIPSLLAIGAVHQHLTRKKLRTQTALFLDSGDAKEVHDFATLFGFGADAICPRIAYQVIRDLNETGRLEALNNKSKITNEDGISNYRKAINLGILKVMSKMGISTLQSYKGAQIYEAVGLNSEVVDFCFTGTQSRIEGAGFDVIGKDLLTVHSHGFPFSLKESGGMAGARAHAPLLRNPGDYHYRHNGEKHYNDPASMTELQLATREMDPKIWDKYKNHSVKANERIMLRGLLTFDVDESKSIPIEEVEPASEIVKRFVTGAMSLGSISSEAHETLGIAMNRLGGRSNTGEGGENPKRYTPEPNGDSKRSAIKQVASGRFGVTAEYLANADQIQIKMAQGAKPGEGGELPGFKVSEEIASTRGTTPGVGLISPPPHHDIYSIEDLAQLIHDLKNANIDSTCSVKLVSEVGVGIVAAGVAKAKADHIVISGGDGGTGAAAWTGIHRAGIPWELGLCEAQQTLMVNDLRSRIRLQADGQMKNGRDVAIAALMGAEEFGFSTTPLIAMGCIMMRKCHLNTCPVGIATQDRELRDKFAGQPEHVVNFFYLLAEEVRSYMALLGFKNIDEMIGRVDKLKVNEKLLNYKTKGLDLSPLLQSGAELNPEAFPFNNMGQDHELENVLDHTLISRAAPAIEDGKKVYYETSVNNLNRSVGAMLSHEVAKKYGSKGLPDDTIHIKFNGSGGQSFGFILAKGITLEVEGDGNDGVGKGLSGGKIIVYPHKETFESNAAQNTPYIAENNVVVGNVACYGATSGEVYFRGLAGERFCVRNSGALAVVEGVGDHGCEYMTGGKVVVLGDTGRNFAAGMSGGIAYVWDPEKNFDINCNKEMVSLVNIDDYEEEEELRSIIEKHRRLTGSSRAKQLLENWDQSIHQFVKVYPDDYKRVLEKMKLESNTDDDDILQVAAGI